MKVSAFTLLFCLFSIQLFSQVNVQKSSVFQSPVSVKSQKSGYAIERKTLVKPNVSRLLDEDKLKREKGGTPLRFGYKIQANYDLNNSGKWTVLENGDKIWLLAIHSEGAKSINLLYDKFWIPKGGRLYIYDRDQSYVTGPLKEGSNVGSFENPVGFASSIIAGDELILEYYEPKDQSGKGVISISDVVYGYKNLRSLTGRNYQKTEDEGAPGNSGSCQVDVNCSEGNKWRREKRSVVRLIVDGISLCTGSLINNTNNDGDPLLLTADHCIRNRGFDAVTNPSLSNLVIWWDYEDEGCKTNQVGTPYASVGATVLANNEDSDFALLRLSINPATFTDFPIDTYFAGWDRTNSQPPGGVGIHHPAGDVKKIATVKGTPVTTAVLTGRIASNFWINEWEQTDNGHSVTEGGSSGSPLFNGNHHIIGQLLGGGGADCASPTTENSKYGKIWASWNIDPNNKKRRLKDWLDPKNTNVTKMDGLDICPFQSTFTASVDVPEKEAQYPEATSTVIANHEINNKAASFYSSGNQVIFNPGFHAKPGSEIIAKTYDKCLKIPAVIGVLSPKSSDVLTAGNSTNINWITSRKLINTNVKIEVFDGMTWSTIVASTPNDGMESIQVPFPNTNFVNNAEIRITLLEDSNVTGTSDPFKINVPDRITVTNPTSTSDWPSGSSQVLRWTTRAIPATDHIKIQIDDGTTFSTLVNSTLNDGNASITIPNIPLTTNDAIFKLTWVENNTIFTLSDNFTISVPKTFAFTNPVSSTVWSKGSSQTISWTSSGISPSDNVKLEFFNGSTWSVLKNSTNNDGSFVINVPNVSSTINNAKIRITHRKSGFTHTSDNFTVSSVNRSFSFIEPTSQTNWISGENQTISWSSTGIPSTDNIKIEFFDGSSWLSLNNSTKNDGSQAISVPVLSSEVANAKIRLTHLGSGYSQESSNFSVIVQQILTITSPQSSTVWSKGGNRTITWTSVGIPSSSRVKVEYFNGINWNTLSTSTPNDGSFSFSPTITTPNNNSHEVKITLTTNTAIFDLVNFAVTDFCSGSGGVLSPTYSVKSITDGSGSSDYLNNMNCTWTIPKPANPNHYLIVDVDIDGFEYVEGENCFVDNDYLTTSAGSLFNRCFGGLSVNPINPDDQFIASFQGLDVNVTWRSNSTVVGPGWSLKYYYSPTPASSGRTSTETEVIRPESHFVTEKEFKVYPNPVSSILKIDSPFEKTLVKVFDISGKEVFCSELDDTNEIDLSELRNGVYWINLNESINKKIIVLH
ncbi:MAG: T9SS type A sorting domain-containing protein [Bacteroidota bacterium]